MLSDEEKSASGRWYLCFQRLQFGQQSCCTVLPKAADTAYGRQQSKLGGEQAAGFQDALDSDLSNPTTSPEVTSVSYVPAFANVAPST